MIKKRVVYILGAGFSAPAGIPVIGNFIFKSKNQFAQDTEKYPQFKRVFNIIDGLSKIKNYANVDLYNIEMVYSLLSARALADSEKEMDIFEEYIKDVVKYHQPAFRQVSGQFSQPRGSFSPEPYINQDNVSLDCYSRFVFGISARVLRHRFVKRSQDQLNEQRLTAADFKIQPDEEVNVEYSVVSFNYDRIIEDAADALTATYGWNDGKIDVTPIKLHGCVTGSIIPPTWNKVLKNSAILDSWKSAHAKISKANEIRFIGFSLPETDMHAKTFFSSCFSDAENIQKIDVLCLDDQPGSVRKRYKDYFCFPKLRFKSENTVNYLLSAFQLRGINPSCTISMHDIEAQHEEFFRGS